MKPHYAILMILSSFIACKTSTSVSSPTEVEVRSNHQYAFPKDTYHFHLSQTSEKVLYISNHDQTNPKKVALYLENLKDVVIDGNNSDFIFHGTILPIVLKNCTNVTLKNFSIDFAIPHFRQLHITEVDKAHNTVVGKLYPEGNYKVEAGKLLFCGEDYEEQPMGGMLFTPDRRLTYQRADVSFNPTKVTELSPNVFKIEGMGAEPRIEKDERFALRNYGRPMPAIFITESKNIKLENGMKELFA